MPAWMMIAVPSENFVGRRLQMESRVSLTIRSRVFLAALMPLNPITPICS